jgi:dehydrogenase/reductase SDR family protein 12
MELDMADLRAVKAFAETFAASRKPLHVLVNNAGCMVHEKKSTPQGMEYNFAVNLFGPWLLTRLLLPYMATFPDPRVVRTGRPRVPHTRPTHPAQAAAIASMTKRGPVAVFICSWGAQIAMSSGGMLMEKLEVNDIQLARRPKFSAVDAYSQQKRQQVELTERWATTVPSVRFFVTHPGWADTPAFREALPDFYEQMKDNVRTAEEGADTAVWLGATQAIPKEFNGQFIQGTPGADAGRVCV